MAEYCVVELTYSGSLKDTAAVVGQTLRVADCLGTDEEGRLLVLLNNTGPENLEYLRERLLTCGVKACSLLDKPAETLGAPAAV